ncbi:MAG TPA: dihydrofolate reductase family protein [Longimicrobium sp.]|nr:dihydrofolate reductase family protein [Longimicrobium sp.]
MRRIIAFNRVSADGYFSAPDGNLNWTVPEPELDRAAAEGLGGTGTILFGRRTYEMFESFWPHALDDSDTAEDPHAAGRRSPEIRAMAEWINNAVKIVFSTTRKEVPWRNSRLLPAFDPAEVEAIKSQPGNDIMIFGSGSIVSQLTEHGLIDEYQFIVGPILLGSGKMLVSGVPSTLRLELAEAKAFPSGNVRLRYTRTGQGG